MRPGAEPLGERARPPWVDVGQADELHRRKAAQRRHVMWGDSSGSDESDAMSWVHDHQPSFEPV